MSTTIAVLANSAARTRRALSESEVVRVPPWGGNGSDSRAWTRGARRKCPRIEGPTATGREPCLAD